MKIAIITDIHMGPDGFWNGIRRKIGTNVTEFVDDFIETMNESVKPSFVMVLGDLIEDENPKNDKEHIRYLVKEFEKLHCPVYFVTGNHDLKNVTEGELIDMFKQKKLFYSLDSGDFHFIVLFSKKINKEETVITEEQIEWLNDDLRKTDKSSFVFVHAGLADQDLTGNPWF